MTRTLEEWALHYSVGGCYRKDSAGVEKLDDEGKPLMEAWALELRGIINDARLGYGMLPYAFASDAISWALDELDSEFLDADEDEDDCSPDAWVDSFASYLPGHSVGAEYYEQPHWTEFKEALGRLTWSIRDSYRGGKVPK